MHTLKQRNPMAEFTYTDIEIALECLADYGLLNHENGIYCVKKLSKKTWIDLLKYRKAIECINLRALILDAAACGNTLVALRPWLDQMEVAVEQNNMAIFYHADVKFHLALASHSLAAYQSIKSLLPFIRIAAPLFVSNVAMKEFFEDHRMIYDCISRAANENRSDGFDEDEIQNEVEALLANHLNRSGELLLAPN